MRLIFLGPPGSGKGTQARVLDQRFGVRQISTGDILRDHRANGTELGKSARGYMERGELVPDELIIAMIEQELETQPDAGFVMDGFPRTLAQAQAFDELFERKHWSIDAAVLFEADRATLMQRLTARWSNPRTGRTYNSISNPPHVSGVDDDDGGPLVQREDDRPETVAKRLDVYQAQTEPLVAYYRARGVLHTIDALRSVDEVTASLLGALPSPKTAR